MAARLQAAVIKPAVGAWTAYIAVGIVAIGAYFAVPLGAHGTLYDLIGLSSVVAIVIGVARYKPVFRLPWYLFAAGQAFFVAGDVLWNLYYADLGTDPFPSAADAFYLGGYPIIAVGLWLLIRSRAPGRDVTSILDATIISVGAGVLTWSFLMAPYIDDPSLSPFEETISVAYPLMDLMLLAVAARLISSAGGRSASYRLVAWSIFLLLGADTVYGYLSLYGTFPERHINDVLWLGSYVLWGAAALHPSVRELASRGSEERVDLRRRWVAVLALASLLAPATLAIQQARGEPLDVPVIVGGSAILFLVALARMAGLSKELERKRLVHKVVAMAERERQIMAADLHDGPIQGLTVLGLNLDLLHMDLQERATESDLNSLEEMRHRMSTEVDALRELMAELRPPMLDERGLVSALVEYAEQLEIRSGLACSVEGRIDGRLPSSLEIALYRIVQEALRNIEKHANADSAWVSLWLEESQVLAMIRDDGVGFDPKTAGRDGGREHFGLAAMKGRVEDLGGEFELQSRPGSGTIVTASLPMEVD
ncbi:MAG: sensor histidine kinase [Actinomycetota bacterium]